MATDRLASLAIFLFLAVLAGYPSIAGEPKSPNAWRFNPAIGLEGQASIVNQQGDRLDAECGNGGGPALILTPAQAKPIVTERTTLTFSIDGTAYNVEFQCSADGVTCVTFGFPSPDVIKGLQMGNTVEIKAKEAPVTSFSLTSSNKAIARLAPCLQ